MNTILFSLQITDSSISASNAVNKMEINAKEPLVVPFGVNEAVTA